MWNIYIYLFYIIGRENGHSIITVLTLCYVLRYTYYIYRVEVYIRGASSPSKRYDNYNYFTQLRQVEYI